MAVNVKESVIQGFLDFWSRKVRSFVTIFGIILGTFSIMVVLAIVQGINDMTMEWILQRGGLKRVMVRSNWQYKKQDAKKFITIKEFDYIRNNMKGVDSFNPKLRRWYPIKKGQNLFHSQANGVIPDFVKVEEWTVDKGRFINEYDVKNATEVIVLGTQIVEELFDNEDPIGKMVTLGDAHNNRRLKVIGVMKHRYMENKGMMGGDNGLAWLNRRSFIPITTMEKKIDGWGQIYNFDVRAKTEKDVKNVMIQLNDLLLNLRNGKPVFTIESALERAAENQKDFAIFSTVFGVISGISLLVGGIVIMNIMLATIQERTREIGIRLAVGAHRLDVFIQFMVQTVIITAFGGFIGLILGYSLLDVISGFLEVNLVATFNMALLGIAVSTGVGLIFGIFPAIRAANMDPVKALRYI